MIIGKLVEENIIGAIYYCGRDETALEDQVFFCINGEVDVIRGDSLKRFEIAKLYGKYTDSFKKGIFPETIIYE